MPNQLKETSIEQGLPVTRTRTRAAVASSGVNYTLVGTNLVKTYFETDTDLVCWRVEESRPFFEFLKSSKSIRNLIPPEFLGLIPEFERTELVLGDVEDPPNLTGSQLAVEQEQVDPLQKRVTSRNLGAPTLPITYQNKELAGERFGGDICKKIVTLDDNTMPVDQGLAVIRSEVNQLGDNLFIKMTERLDTAVTWPILRGKKYDPECRGYIDIETQVVPIDYVPITNVDYVVEELEPIDKWRSRRVRQTKTAYIAHNSPQTAVISYRYSPFQFPGTLDYARLITYDHREGYRRASAMLCKHTVRTWWVIGDFPPTVGPGMQIDVKEIITDTVNIPIFSPNNTTLAETFPDVLHNSFVNTLGALYPATTPSFTEYYMGTSSGVTASFFIAAVLNPGTNYLAGHTSCGGGHCFTILGVGPNGELMGFAPSPNPPVTYIAQSITLVQSGVAMSGGTGGTADLYQVVYLITTPGSGWVGTEKVIAAAVTPTDVPRLWKIQTEAVLMR